MANYGLSTPFIAPYVEETGSYINGFRCNQAVKTGVDPKFAEGKIFGDNEIAEQVQEFSSADVTLETTGLPMAAASSVFGHTVDTAKKKIVYKKGDTPKHVGYGFYTTEMVNGKKQVVACVLPKVLFKEPGEEFETVGDNIVFKTPKLTGTATYNKEKEWRIKQTFDKETDAISFLMDYLNIAQ